MQLNEDGPRLQRLLAGLRLAREHRTRRPSLGRSLRLTSLALFVGMGAFGHPATVHSDDTIRAAVTYFQEPAPNTPLIVVHPQVAYGQDYTAHFGIDVSYDADVVTGATPQIFGVDVVTAATRFDDARHNGSLGFRFLTEFATLRVGGGFAGESDYLSGTVSVGASTDLFNRNTQIALDYTHNFDRVCDAANSQSEELVELRALDNSGDCFTDSDLTATRKLNIDSVQLTVTQTATPWLVFQFGAHGQILHGFQANPYRAVQLGNAAVQEHLPSTRNRIAGFARAKLALKPIRGAIDLNLRGYADSWALEALSVEGAWHQYLARPLIARIRARWHYQDSALFYRDGNQYASSGPVGSYWTGDRELSALMNTTLGLKITYLWRAQARPFLKFVDQITFSAKSDLLFYRSLTENPHFSPNAERTSGFLDAIVAQAQVSLDF